MIFVNDAAGIDLKLDDPKDQTVADEAVKILEYAPAYFVFLQLDDRDEWDIHTALALVTDEALRV